MKLRLLVALALVPFLGCLTPGLEARRELRLYELSGARMLKCEIAAGVTKVKGRRGGLRCTSPDGERFQGEWMRLRESTKEGATGDQGDMSSLPVITVRNSLSPWEWAGSMGVDLEKNAERCIFLLYGDRGTVIDGIVVGETAGSDGLMGAARDNKGRKYRVMG